MSAIAIDTLAISKRLVANGYSQQQAEVQAEILAEVVDTQLVTKADLKELEYRLIIKLGGMLVVAITIITALVKTVH